MMSYNSSNKGTTKTRESAQITDLAVEWLIDELTTAATKAPPKQEKVHRLQI